MITMPTNNNFFPSGLNASSSAYDGVLFDLDGTLLDTANDLGEALNYILGQYNKPPVNREHYRPVASDGSTGLLQLGFKENLKNYDLEILRQEFLTYYENNIAKHTTIYKGVENLIHFLDRNNIPWGIVTNKPIGLTHLLLPYFPLFKKCKSIVGGDSLPQRKPHPAPVLYACKELGIEANKCIYVGDAPRDIEAGNAANMLTIIAKWGYIENVEECIHWGADVMYSNAEEILSLFTD